MCHTKLIHTYVVTTDAMSRKLRLSINQLNFYWTNLSTRQNGCKIHHFIQCLPSDFAHLLIGCGSKWICDVLSLHGKLKYLLIPRKTLLSETFFLIPGSVRKSSWSLFRCIGVCQRPWQNTCLTSLGRIQERNSKIHSDSIWHVFQRYRIGKIPQSSDYAKVFWRISYRSVARR